MKQLMFLLLLAFTFYGTSAQDDKYFRRAESPILVDTTSTLFFMIQGDDNPKTSSYGEHNVVVYDFTRDTYKRLFDHDVHIQTTAFYPAPEIEVYNTKPKRPVNPRWVFYIVKASDTNASGELEDRDASILYVSDARGENLRALTTEQVNVVKIRVFDKLGFALVELQREATGDKSFTYQDRNYYFQKIDLKDLSIGKPIEVGARP